METTYYAIRGVVIGHGVRESGWWLWKTRKEYFQVRFDRKQLAKLNAEIPKMKEATPSTGRCVHPVPRDINVFGIEGGWTRTRYPVGTRVGITFVYADEMTQFNLGTMAFGFYSIQVVKRGTILEHEV